MDSIFIGRGLVPLFDISRPLLKCPPWSTILSEIDLNQAPQACMISGVGFINPKCRYTNFFTSLLVDGCSRRFAGAWGLANIVFSSFSYFFFIRRAISAP